MKLIGAGCPRTGTLSTHGALTRLGLPCYHMLEVVTREDQTRLWHSFLVEGKPMDWKGLFADYEATVDAPGSFFYREILEAFPKTKVLLNVREPESWYQSYTMLQETAGELRPRRASNPRLDMWLRVVEGLHERFAGVNADRAQVIAAFNAHNRRVQEEIPKEQLLVFRVQDGWAPLCEFLGRTVPDEPFPHLNEGADTVRAGLSATFGIG